MDGQTARADDTKPFAPDMARQATTAAESMDAMTAGRIMNQISPEEWAKFGNWALNYNKNDSPSLPSIGVAYEVKGTSQTLSLFSYNANKESDFATHIASVTKDFSSPSETLPLTPELIRKATTAAEYDDAVTTGNILAQVGPEQWAKLTRGMLDLNKKDSSPAPWLGVSYDVDGAKQTLSVFRYAPSKSADYTFPIATVTIDQRK